MAEKLNSMRVLERAKVAYRVHTYATAGLPDAAQAAALIGIDAARVFKTLVTLPDDARRPVLAMVPAAALLDLKRLAALLDLKRLAMAPQRSAEQLTGLLVGGIGVLALTDRRWPTVIDSSARDWSTVVVSAGRRGLMLELAPDDLVSVSAARVGAICRSGAFADEGALW